MQADILSYFSENTRRNNFRYIASPIRPQRNVINFPEYFSFIESPDEAIATLTEIADAVSSDSNQTVYLNQDDCILIDYGAEAVACIISKAGAVTNGLRFEGRYPNDPALAETVIMSGIPKVLGVPHPRISNVTPFQLHHGRANQETAYRSSEKERSTSHFVSYMQTCLRQHGWRLNTEGMRYLGGLVSEVVGNAEDHAGRDDWWIGGYMRVPEDSNTGDCHIVIFNLGRTIYQSMQDIDEGSPVRRDIERLVNKHKKMSFFNPNYQEEQLWTLYALQQGVSRLREIAIDRGQGTADMIRFFQSLGKTSQDGVEPKMCVVSGSSFILFNEDYEMRRERRNGEERSIIAFNSSNDLNQRPDKRNVRCLKRFFPGTLISLRFYFDRDHLDNLS